MSPIRWTLIVGLLAAGGYGLHLHGQEAPSSAASIAPASGAGTAWVEPTAKQKSAQEDALRERFDLYRTLRLQDDVVALYELADPEHRSKITLANFIAFYGHGMVRFRDLQLDSIEFDWRERRATVTALTTAELLVDKLPKSYRVSKGSDEDAQITAPNGIVWVQRGDGQWYFRMDQQIVNGQTADGRGVKPF